MSKKQYDRLKMLVGEDVLEKIQERSVLVFGLGGVGGHAAEALARCGIGRIGLVDCDRVEETNLNRQIVALRSSLGRMKTEVMAERIGDMDPDISVEGYSLRFGEETLEQITLQGWDYVVDAIDDVPAKLLLIRETCRLRIPIIVCMGTGNKMDPSRLRVATLDKTHTCPLARAVRKGAGDIDQRCVKTVFSDELPARAEGACGRRPSPASNSFVPASAGLLMAAEVIRDLCR